MQAQRHATHQQARGAHRPCALHTAARGAHRAAMSRPYCAAQQQPAAVAGEGQHSASGSQPTPAEVTQAWALLKTYSTDQFRGQAQRHVGSAEGRAKLRDALLLAYSQPCAEQQWVPGPQPEVLMGIMASDARLAVRALRDWCQALALDFVPPECRVTGADSVAAVEGAVYVKYNPLSKLCYLSSYQGKERGVLLKFGLEAPMLGTFPLGFFDEARVNPPPAL